MKWKQIGESLKLWNLETKKPLTPQLPDSHPCTRPSISNIPVLLLVPSYPVAGPRVKAPIRQEILPQNPRWIPDFCWEPLVHKAATKDIATVVKKKKAAVKKTQKVKVWLPKPNNMLLFFFNVWTFPC